MNSDPAEIAGILKEKDNIVIAGHISPDGDAVGACMAMALSLRQIGKKPIVLLEPYSEKYSVIPGKEFLLEPDENIRSNIKGMKPDVFLALDCADKGRLGRFKDVFKRSDVTICVDHHASNEPYADYNLIVPDISSTCEIVYHIVTELGVLNEDIATALYAGIVFDTGGFRHDCAGASTHEITSKLLALNIDFSRIYRKLMVEHTLMEARCFALAIGNMICLHEEGIAFTSISAQQRNELGASVKDYSGIVEYILNTKGVKVAFFAYEKTDEEVKVSFRAKRHNVSEIAVKYGGGGHKLAAGCTIKGDINKVTDTILKELREGINEV